MSEEADATRKELRDAGYTREAGYTHEDAEEAERVADRIDVADQDEDGGQGLDEESARAVTVQKLSASAAAEQLEALDTDDGPSAPKRVATRSDTSATTSSSTGPMVLRSSTPAAKVAPKASATECATR